MTAVVDPAHVAVAAPPTSGRTGVGPGRAAAGDLDSPIEPDRPSVGSTLLIAGLLALVVAAAGAAYAATFVPAYVALAVVLGAALPSFAVVFAARSVPGVVGPALAGIVATAVAVAVAVLVGGGSIADVVTGVTSGWSDLLTRTLPVDAAPTALVVPAATCGLAAVLTALLAVRTRAALVPLAGPVVLVAVARLLGGPAPSPRWAPGLLVGAAVLVGASRGAERAGRAVARAAPVAAAALVVGVLLGAVLPLGRARPPVNLRDQRVLSLDDLTRSNPLTDTRAAAVAGTDGETVVARVRLDGPAPAAGALTLVSLDAYDGSAWTSSARFERTGATLPAAGPLVSPTPLRQELEIVTDVGPWVPAASRPARVEVTSGGGGLVVDPVGGTVAAVSGSLPAGTKLTIESVVPSVRPADAQTAAVPADRALAPYTVLPGGVPPTLGDAARQAMGTARSPFQQASALEAWLRDGGRFTLDPEGAGGSSLGLLSRFVTEGPKGRRGTEEQFAAAFVVLARSRGLPARLSVGYRLQGGGRGSGSRSYEVRAHDLAVWPEVAFAGLGWVPFDPVPRTGGAAPVPVPDDDPVDVAKQQAAQLATDPNAGPPPPPSNPVLQGTATESASSSRPLLIAIGVGGALLVVLVLTGLRRWVLPSRRRRRRSASRRHAPDPRQRALGAWHEVIDRLDERTDAADARALTVPEAVELTRAVWGESVAEPVGLLGRVVSDAAFSPDGATAHQADDAWARADAVLPLLTPVG